jgi:hypothetical protein
MATSQKMEVDHTLKVAIVMTKNIGYGKLILPPSTSPQSHPT